VLRAVRRTLADAADGAPGDVRVHVGSRSVDQAEVFAPEMVVPETDP
jgi:hypothetical protein